MSTFLSIIAALVILSVFVVVHELGHFLVARAFKFEILEFAVGMGPCIWKKTKNGIQYSLRAIPMGGMCRFYGEDESVEGGSRVPFNKEAKWKRALVTFAGPLMNVLTAVLFAVIALLCYGDFMPVIDSFSGENTVAETMGIQPGDYIVAVNGQELTYYGDASTFIKSSPSDEVSITVEREGKRLTLVGHDIYDEEAGSNMIGIYMRAERKAYGLFDAVGHSVAYVWSIGSQMIEFIISIFTKGVSRGDVVGPVGTISIIGQAVRLGFETVLRLSVLISVNLGIMNLLPLPALDGGRLVFIGIEAVRGKAIPVEKEGMVHLIGMGLLLLLVVYLTFSDVSGLIGG